MYGPNGCWTFRAMMRIVKASQKPERIREQSSWRRGINCMGTGQQKLIRWYG